MELPTKAPEIGDTFGQILTRCWASGAAPWSAVEIIKRDDGRIDAHDASTCFSEPERWAALERWAWEQATGRILDGPSGATISMVPGEPGTPRVQPASVNGRTASAQWIEG